MNQILKDFILRSNLSPEETFPGMNIDDLNRYLPAIQASDDISKDIDTLKEGIYLSNPLEGLKNIPSQSIDLIIAEPPKDPWDYKGGSSQMTLQEYYQWNEEWLAESKRVLKNTGGIYLLCDWKSSSMYHGLLAKLFIIQTRITWNNKSISSSYKTPTWRDKTGDIWFATKSEDFLFNLHAVSLKSDRERLINNINEKTQNNLWLDIPTAMDKYSRLPEKLFSKIFEASSFKLNWVLDPFMRNGDVGVAAKKYGRRFIGLEVNKDLLLLAMKRINETNNN